MKTFCKYLFTFVAGASFAAVVISIFLPSTISASRGSFGSYDEVWSLAAFEEINAELPQLVDEGQLKFTVIPACSGSGYQVVGFDSRLRARFGMTNWDDALDKIDSRMRAIQNKEKKQNKAEMAMPRKPSD